MSDVTTELANEANDKAAEIARLKADNERLREELDAAKHDLSIFSGRIVELDAENAKLRKLLLDVWNDAMRFDGFWDYVNDDGEIYREDELPHYQDRMRELGIGVDDA